MSHDAAQGPAVSGRPAAAVVVASDRCSRGEATDVSGPRAVDLLTAAGLDVAPAVVVPDGARSVREALEAALNGPVRLVVTCGGTGIGPRDETPEGTLPLLARELPGIADAIRREGAATVPTALLSRGLAGLTARGQLVVNLAGSPAAVEQGIAVLTPLLAHVFDQLDGGDHP